MAVPVTSESSFASSGSLGQHTMGSVTWSMSISMVVWYVAPASASSSVGLASHSSMLAMRRSMVRRSP